MEKFFCDDKIVIILAVFIITLFSIYFYGEEGKNVVTNAFSGLFGIAIGKSINPEPPKP
jgi:hypothetical protein